MSKLTSVTEPAPSDLPAGRPVFARHAASLLVVRHGSDGPEVLMGVRASGHRFLPNRLVFPGGAVDLVDRVLPAASEPTPEVITVLRRSVGPRLARGIVMAAARELQEETGLSLGSPPRLDALHYLCRAITPTDRPIRFNARFLLAEADATAGEPADTHELLDVRYIALQSAGELDLMPVTRWVLGVLADWLALPLAQRRTYDRVSVFRDQRPGPDR